MILSNFELQLNFFYMVNLNLGKPAGGSMMYKMKGFQSIEKAPFHMKRCCLHFREFRLSCNSSEHYFVLSLCWIYYNYYLIHFLKVEVLLMPREHWGIWRRKPHDSLTGGVYGSSSCCGSQEIKPGWGFWHVLLSLLFQRWGSRNNN